jgi:hypothetical protein
MKAKGLAPAIPDAKRIAVKVFPEPDDPASPMRRPTASRTAGLKENVIGASMFSQSKYCSRPVDPTRSVAKYLSETPTGSSQKVLETIVFSLSLPIG